MDDFWTNIAVRLKTELTTRGVELGATDEVIVASVGDWFATFPPNTKAAVIATMRNLASA